MAASYGSDVVVELLTQLGIEHAAFNPGATFRGIHDSLVNHAGPGIIECLHEEISVAIAHGYAKAAGRPMAAIVHDVVGLQHATMAIYNAWCDRVPMLVLGATGPMDAARRRPWIDWLHTASVQATQVRDYTKWDDQPGSLEATPESLVRAMQLTTTVPRGPVYVCLDSEVQEQQIPPNFPTFDPTAFVAPSRLAPDLGAIEQLAGWLTAAERPIVLTDLAARDPKGFDLLVELAELLALPVIDLERDYNKAGLNLPTQHPLNLSGDAAELIGEADLVLSLEMRDLSGPLGALTGARVVHVSLDHLITRAWTSDFQRLHPANLHIAAEIVPTLAAMLPRVRTLLAEDAAAPDRIEHRRRRLEDMSDRRRKTWRHQADADSGASPIGWAPLAAVLDEVTRGSDRVVANGHLGNWVHRLWSLDRPHQYLGDSGGAGLGYGLGASVGAALAHKDSDRLVIDIQSDGDALMTPQALWTAAHHQLPLLIVMDNNRAYRNSLVHAGRVARSRERPTERQTVGTMIDSPAVDFSAMARAYGVHAEGPVSEIGETAAALQRAVRIVQEERRPVLVDVVTSLPDA